MREIVEFAVTSQFHSYRYLCVHRMPIGHKGKENREIKSNLANLITIYILFMLIGFAQLIDSKINSVIEKEPI